MLKSTGLVRDFHKSLVRGEEREPGAGCRPRITWQGCLWGRAERLPTCVPASRDPPTFAVGRGSQGLGAPHIRVPEQEGALDIILCGPARPPTAGETRPGEAAAHCRARVFSPRPLPDLWIRWRALQFCPVCPLTGSGSHLCLSASSEPEFSLGKGRCRPFVCSSSSFTRWE